jgi:hypothetical protein
MRMCIVLGSSLLASTPQVGLASTQVVHAFDTCSTGDSRQQATFHCEVEDCC